MLSGGVYSREMFYLSILFHTFTLYFLFRISFAFPSSGDVDFVGRFSVIRFWIGFGLLSPNSSDFANRTSGGGVYPQETRSRVTFLLFLFSRVWTLLELNFMLKQD